MTSKRRKKHKPEQIVAKMRDADAMLNAGKELAAVLQALEISEATLGWDKCFPASLTSSSVMERWDDARNCTTPTLDDTVRECACS